MNIKIFLLQPSGDIKEVVFTDVDEVRYEKANENNGKPDVLTVLNNTKSTDWGSYEVVGEFSAKDVVGWAKFESGADPYMP